MVTSLISQNKYTHTRTFIDEKKDVYDHKKFVSRWFKYLPFEEVYHSNMCEYVAWAFYFHHYTDLDEEEKEVVKDMVQEMSVRFDTPAPPGYNPNANPMKFTLEPIDYLHLPLAFYFVMYGFRVIGRCLFRHYGFQEQELHGVRYWYRPAPATNGRDGEGSSRWSDDGKGNCNGNVGAPSPGCDNGRKKQLPLLFFHGITPVGKTDG